MAKKRAPSADQQRQDRNLAQLAVSLVRTFASRYPDAGLNFAIVPLEQFASSPIVERKRKPKARHVEPMSADEAMRG